MPASEATADIAHGPCRTHHSTLVAHVVEVESAGLIKTETEAKDVICTWEFVPAYFGPLAKGLSEQLNILGLKRLHKSPVREIKMFAQITN